MRFSIILSLSSKDVGEYLALDIKYPGVSVPVTRFAAYEIQG
jgi:hypothetical protein